MTRSILSIAFWRPVWFKKIALYLDYQEKRRIYIYISMPHPWVRQIPSVDLIIFWWKVFFKKVSQFHIHSGKGAWYCLCLVFVLSLINLTENTAGSIICYVRSQITRSMVQNFLKVLISFSFQRCRNPSALQWRSQCLIFFRLQEGCCCSECRLD